MSIKHSDFHSPTFCEQNCNVTLRQALDEYYAQNPDFHNPDQFENGSKNILFPHDVCHIIFGCDTRIAEEFKIEIWTFFATNFSFKIYYDDYLSPLLTMEKNSLKEVSGVFLSFFTLPNLIQYMLAIPGFAKTFFAARKVNPKWDYYNYQVHLDRSVSDVRQEFNIQVV